ncbi:MAG: efflux RND transporter permease subunit [Thermodesulfobacteriota bacterium]
MNESRQTEDALAAKGLMDHVILFCLKNRLVVLLVTLLVVGAGVIVAPFDWETGWIARRPVPVDAIPDIGENQQVVFTEWMGRSPQDVEDQVTYPLTVALLGVPRVKSVRSFSMFGFSTIYVIFDEGADFYWSRTRILEKLSSLPPGVLPDGVRPSLGPDATALGQVFWYTLEGRDKDGKPTGGWDLDELRSIQDFTVRYALLAAEGVSEVASVGGFVKEYQVDVDPDAMRAAGVTLEDVLGAVKMSNLDVSAGVIEINRAEYSIRGVGFVKKVSDIEDAVVKVSRNLPIRVRDVARVQTGPALRRGVLDKMGAEVTGGVVVVRYGANPLAAINNVKKKIAEIAPGLPRKTLADGTVSQVTVVPFYDRTGLIHETLETLNTALSQEIILTIIVVLISVMHLASSVLISALLPIAVLACFLAMKIFGVDANIVALSGIAIAIGTMVDMGIIICENILKHRDEAPPGQSLLVTVYNASSEVGSAVLTAVSTTIVSFLPVFVMTGAEGKLFKPLAFTKTFALFASVIVALTILPTLATILFRSRDAEKTRLIKRLAWSAFLFAGGVFAGVKLSVLAGLSLCYVAVRFASAAWVPPRAGAVLRVFENYAVIFVVTLLLAMGWMPLGLEKGLFRNFLFVGVMVGVLMGGFRLFQHFYPRMLRVCLDHKVAFLSFPAAITVLGMVIWLGAPRIFFFLPASLRSTSLMTSLFHEFPGLGKEFMPQLNEGSFLFMPTTMPHASITEVQDILRKQDMAISAIPEVESAVGKLGRVESPLDPAPISMIETVINYQPEYVVDKNEKHVLFAFDPDAEDLFRDQEGNAVLAPDGLPYKVRGKFLREPDGRLRPDPKGMPFRLWRPALDPDLNPGRPDFTGIHSTDDIWAEITAAAKIPGVTSAPKLMPIAARIVMLQSGMRAPMGIKVKGPDLATIEKVGLELESLVKQVPSVEPSAVVADRIVGKPYLEIVIDRDAISRYGVMMRQVQEAIEAAVGGQSVTTTVEGRERYSVRVRYMRELRDNIEAINGILVSGASGQQVPLSQVAKIRYVRGPDMIKSEDTFLTGYVLFDKKPGFAEVDVVDAVKNFLAYQMKQGNFTLPAGVSYAFAGSYENQIRAQHTLALVLPLALTIILIILYLQFRQLSTTLMVFSGIFVAWSGGFILIWLYGRDWFLDFTVFGTHMRTLFQVHPINLSVAVWVGFLALFGIASDDGVLMATYLDETRAQRSRDSQRAIRNAVVLGAQRRIRPALMTSATTILALIPVITSAGRGSDIMVPMALPSFGGMVIELLTVFVVPILYCAVEEYRAKQR